ncbi:glycoside hydrolase family 3 protein [Backusella circina FSU 941]|nr:glycoside hydrolase family 3 protein [Backusella circina FSU 941]
MTKVDLKHEVGQLLMCGFDSTEPTEGILDLIRNHNLGSVIYFSRNIESAAQVQKLTLALQRAAKEAGHKRPLFIAVDQENGVVRRLGSSGTYLPGSMALGAIGSSSAASQVARATAKELKVLGMNWNLAPDMDVNNNPLNPVIGVRSFGEDPQLVAKLGIAQVEAYHKSKIATSIKHFPGHGDTATDSHLGVPVIDKDMSDLDKVELVPFYEAIQSKGDAYPSSVMTGHISLPKIIKEKNRVACIASEVVTDILRKKLGYQGIAITDCLEMDAVKDTVGTPQGAVLALQAGNDIAMISHTLTYQKDAFKLIYQGLDQGGELNETQLTQSLERVAALKDRFLSWDDALTEHDLGEIGCQEHVDLSKRLYKDVPTIVRDRENILPFKPESQQKVLFLAAHVPLTLAIDSESEPFNSMYEALKFRHSNTEYVIFNEHTEDLTNKIEAADYVIIGTANGNLHPFQATMVKLGAKHAKKLAVIAVINPYDLMDFPELSTFIVTYEYTPPAHEAAIAAVFGEIQPLSRLPITIPSHNDTNPSPFCVEPYHEQQHLEAVYQIWKSVYDPTWPLTLDKFSLVLSRLEQPRHFVVKDPKDDSKIVGFAATQNLSDGNHGQLALVLVEPEYQRRGIGTLLNDTCVDMLKRAGCSNIKLGSSYPRFFCGVPDGNDTLGQEAQAFFKRRGWTFQSGVVYDLIGDLTHYEMPVSIKDRMEKEQITFDVLHEDQVEELFAFQAKYFPYWLWTYQHHIKLGDLQDILVAKEKDGRIIGSLVANTKNSHKYRSDLIWRDESLYGPNGGGMACVGVASEERGRGIGIGIVAYANTVLRDRGVDKSYVDWVELVDFYRRTGYETWRSYRLGFV